MEQQIMPVQPPMLTRALEYGFLNQKLSMEFIEGFTDQLASVTVKVAEKFTSTVSEDKLLEAQSLAIGCISLALQVQFPDSVERCAEELLKTPAAHLFRMGFTLIDQLLKKPYRVDYLSKTNRGSDYAFDFERVFISMCSCDPLSQWQGREHYESELKQRIRSQNDHDALCWLLEKALGKNYESQLERMAAEHLEPPANSFLRSALYGYILDQGKLRVRLTVEQAQLIARLLDSMYVRDISKILRSFGDQVPSEHALFFKDSAEILIGEIAEHRREGWKFNDYLTALSVDCSVDISMADIDAAAETMSRKRKPRKQKKP